MMFSRKLAESIAKSRVIEQDEVDIYCFGIQIITETMVLMFAFVLIRQYASRFHADKIYPIGALAMISLIVILLLFPVDSKYKPIFNSDKKRYEKNC